MKLKWLILFPVLLAGCAQPTAAKLESLYRMEISADSNRLTVGGTVRVEGTIFGAFGNPKYFITVTDQTASASDWKITLLPDNTIEKTQGESAILELASTKIIANTLIIVFRGRSAGSAAVVIGVNGEIGEMDSSGNRFFNYSSRYSESLNLEVR
jgi:hypothetical protein